MRSPVCCGGMDAPSIEALLSRKNHGEYAHPVARRLHTVPVLGSFARAWVRAARSDEPRAQWASLPPVAAA